MLLVELGLPCRAYSHWQEAEYALKVQEGPGLLPRDEFPIILQSQAIEDVLEIVISFVPSPGTLLSDPTLNSYC